MRVHGNIWIEEFQEGPEGVVIIASDSTGTAIKDANGNYITTTTDGQGGFSLTVPDNAYVKTMHTGMKPLLWKATKYTYPQQFNLSSKANTLPEVVVRPQPGTTPNKGMSTGSKLGLWLLAFVGIKKIFGGTN